MPPLHKQVQICSSSFPLVISPTPSRLWAGKPSYIRFLLPLHSHLACPNFISLQRSSKNGPATEPGLTASPPSPQKTRALGFATPTLLPGPYNTDCCSEGGLSSNLSQSVGPVSHQPKETVESRASCVNVLCCCFSPKRVEGG